MKKKKLKKKIQRKFNFLSRWPNTTQLCNAFIHRLAFGYIFRSTLWTVPRSNRRHHYIDTFKVEPFDRTIGSVAGDHLRHLVVRTATVAIDAFTFARWSTSGRWHYGIANLIRLEINRNRWRWRSNWQLGWWL